MKYPTPLIVVAALAAGLVSTGLFLAMGWMLVNDGPDFLAWEPEPVPLFQDVDIQPEAPRFNRDDRALTPEQLRAARGDVVSAANYQVAGPFTHGNLAVYLIQGADTMKGQKILTLREGLDQGVAVVHETRGGQLAIDNQGQVPLFIQSGDIVKGGIQDRTVPYDYVVPPQTRRASLPALCVEQGRSFPRGQEPSWSFQTATEQLPGRQLRLAALYRHSQGDVWEGIRRTQGDLTRAVGNPVQAALSQTSLQLTLENPNVNQAVDNYLQALAGLPDGKANVIGFAVAINGAVQTADVYASAEMFDKLWQKSLRASAVAALAERRPGASPTPPSTGDLQKFLTDAEAGQAFQANQGSQSRMLRCETPTQLLFETCDPVQGNLILHRSFLAK